MQYATRDEVDERDLFHGEDAEHGRTEPNERLYVAREREGPSRHGAALGRAGQKGKANENATLYTTNIVWRTKKRITQYSSCLVYIAAMVRTITHQQSCCKRVAF